MSWKSWVHLALLVSGLNLAFPDFVWAGDVEFHATVDQSSISVHDVVTLTFSLQSNGATLSGNPEFKAPDFEVVNTYNSFSQNFQYDSTTGAVVSVKQQQFTKVLHPLKTGDLRISGIQAKVGGQVLKADDLLIQVSAGGRSQANSGAPSGAKRFPQRRGMPLSDDDAQQGTPAFVRAILSKNQVFKGEQLTVSYYLYHRVRVFNIQVDKYPVLNGFLREDLEMPMMGQRLNSERVVENGVTYERALLARYAAYPLQAGDLEIDSLSLKYNYYLDSPSNSFGDVDPFFGFFQQMAPRVGNAVSDRMRIKVKAPPLVGKPESFTGGVGDFSVSTAVDKYQVHENEAVTVTLKVEGRGNTPAIEEPRKNWPPGIELYDSKGRSQVSRNGIGEKVFELLLIPRVAGKITLPPLELGFFNPDSGRYYTKIIEPIPLTVLPATAGSALVPSLPQRRSDRPDFGSSMANSGIPRELKVPEAGRPDSSDQNDTRGRPLWRWINWGFFLVLGLFILLVGFELSKQVGRKARRKRSRRQGDFSESWSEWNTLTRRMGDVTSMKEVRAVCSDIGEWIFDFLDSLFQIGARSMPRAELKEFLIEQKKVSKESWERLEGFLEYADALRFSGTADDLSTESAFRLEVRDKMLSKVQAVEAFFKTLHQRTEIHG